ncbi:MAG: hypothetical protein KF788_13455 [Piscinibacter sp.]|nr:hypothetical protein [Piscinibacter sp.]
MTARIACLLALAACCAQAQEAKVPPPGEPKVERLVHEDKGSRIEELRVRGATQRIVVTPKVGTTRGYEIITGDGSRDLGDGANTSRGAAGKRVWHVLSF